MHGALHRNELAQHSSTALPRLLGSKQLGRQPLLVGATASGTGQQCICLDKQALVAAHSSRQSSLLPAPASSLFFGGMSRRSGATRCRVPSDRQPRGLAGPCVRPSRSRLSLQHAYASQSRVRGKQHYTMQPPTATALSQRHCLARALGTSCNRHASVYPSML